MWDMYQSCQASSSEQLKANYRHTTEHDLISAIPHLYYRNTLRPVVVDKCRSWTLAANQDLVRRFITDQPKTIVLTRDIDEIVESFASLHRRNNKYFDQEAFMREGSEPLMRSLRGVEWARTVNNGEFLFIDYAELVDDASLVLTRIYEFIEVERWDHNLTAIVNEMPEDDEVYGLTGMHEIRPSIGRRNVASSQK